MWSTHSGYYSTLKSKGQLIHTTAWANLEDTELSDINQLQKDNSYAILLI